MHVWQNIFLNAVAICAKLYRRDPKSYYKSSTSVLYKLLSRVFYTALCSFVNFVFYKYFIQIYKIQILINYKQYKKGQNERISYKQNNTIRSLIEQLQIYGFYISIECLTRLIKFLTSLYTLLFNKFYKN